MEKRWEWRRRMSVKEVGRYKYVLDVSQLLSLSRVALRILLTS
jgi:hypothetical protein